MEDISEGKMFESLDASGNKRREKVLNLPPLQPKTRTFHGIQFVGRKSMCSIISA